MLARAHRLLAALAAVLTLAACDSKPAATAAAPSAPGSTARIAALSPAVAVILRDIGLADRIVARHDYDLVLPASIPAAGHQEAIDYEALLAADPTHVVIEWGSRELPPRLTGLAESNGWRLKPVRLLTLDDIAATVDDLYLTFGGADFRDPTGSPASGRRRPPGLPEMRLPTLRDPAAAFEAELPSARLARAWSRRGDGFEAVGRVLLLGAVAPAYAAPGPGSFHHEILVRIGGVPALEEGSPWVELDAEDILRLAPEAIVLIAPRSPGEPAGETSVERVREMLGRVGELGIPAVREGRLALIDDPLAFTPSTAMADFADRLAEILAAWRAAEAADAGGNTLPAP